MSDIKSYSVGNGDMFYISHNTDNFTIIDCCLADPWEKDVLSELAYLAVDKGVMRFISTHPDEDHIRGLKKLDERLKLLNFYCVANNATKADQSISFDHYCALRDSTKAFHIAKNCCRKWMNLADHERKSAGISILWPDPQNTDYKDALAEAARGGCPNNMSAIVKYAVQDGVSALWMGDLETDFMSGIEEHLDLSQIDLLFAPHHGRYSGRVPDSILAKLSPRLIIIGEAPAEDLYYYSGYPTITQNRAGDILFECVHDEVNVFTSNRYTSSALINRNRVRQGYHYVGTVDLNSKR